MSSAKRDPKRDAEMPEAKAYTLTTPVDLVALDAALLRVQGAAGRLGGVPVVAEGLADASEDTPATLWVLDPDVAPETVRKAVTAAQEVEAPISVADQVAPLRAKAQRGEDLTADEMQTALRLLLTRGA